MKDPNEWVINGLKTTSNDCRERKFKQIVQTYGKKNLNNYLIELVNQKIEDLTKESMWDFTPCIYQEISPH